MGATSPGSGMDMTMTKIVQTDETNNRSISQIDAFPSNELDESVSFLSHELRTPLTSIRAVLGLLLSGKLDSLSQKSQRLLEIAINNTDRLVRLTKAIENEIACPTNLLSSAAMERLRLETDLGLALERQEFELFYQPIVSVGTNRINGFEALIRWRHPTRGLVSPAEFIPVAEEIGLINQVGIWVLRQACYQLCSWQQTFQFHPPLTISVNLSSLQLSQSDLVEHVQRILQETGVAPDSLRLEITESALIENLEIAIACLRQLKALGIQLYIDDFGTGYSSLSRLQDLPVDLLKIDRSFVNQQKWDLIWVIMMLAANAGLGAIAEGVETAEELEHLQQMGCQQVQGYFFSKPVDSRAAGKLIAAGLDRCQFNGRGNLRL